jgi:WD40 repeat protein
MSVIFISHSSKDNAWALRIKEWLKEPAQGFEGTFLDFDPQNGIPAGRDWEKELFHQLRRCRAVIALCSEHFNASQWCLSEVAIASNLGKSLFPVEIVPCSPPALLRKHQITRFTQDPEEGFLRLARGLAETSLDPKDIFQWDGKRTPYPGLMAFQEADAPVLFGRDHEIQEGLDRLHNLRRYGGNALLLVLGASGCGKSSLVRAGIVPRLRRDPENWLVLEPFRPRSNPFAELADVLTQAIRTPGETPPAPPTTAQEMKAQLEDLRRRRGYREASVVMVIDQFEELLAGDGSGSDSTAIKPGDGAGSSPAERFLAFLRDATQEADGRLVVLATLRSDFLSSFQCHPALVGVPFKVLKLGPMEAPDYARVIQGPAEVAGLVLEAGLTDRMVADTFTGDALPLLAFTLREMWERYGKDGDLSLTKYELLGRLEGSVQRAADGVHGARPLSAEEEEALRRAFLQLCRINEEGQHARSTAQWKELPPASRETLQRFVKARLLVSGKQNGTIEVAHEALLRTWPLLRRWLEESQEFLLWKRRFQGALEEYKISGTLLAGKPLEEAESWRDQTAENSAEGRMIDASLAARRRRRCRNLLLAGVAGLAVAGFTGGLWWQLQTIRQWQAQVFLKEHQRLIESDPLESVVNGLAAMAHSLESDPGRSLALSDSLPRVMAGIVAVSRQPIQSGQGGVRSLVELKNGELVSGGNDGTLRRWRDGRAVGQPIQTGQEAVVNLIELKNGELISGGNDGTLRRWRDGRPVGQPIQTGQEAVVNLIELKNGELISCGLNGTLRRWRDGKPVGQPIQTGQGWVSSLIELKNGELISGGDDGTLRRWRDGKPVGQTIRTGQGRLSSLIELKNGELVSGGNDGTLRRWRDGKAVGDGQPIQTGQRMRYGGVNSLIELKNGELISGGNDGTLRRWRDGKPVDGGQPIQTGQWNDFEGVISLIELKNGELISGGDDGTLRRWRAGKPVEGSQTIQTGQRELSVIELKNGELISGGVDGTLRSWRNGKPVGQTIQTGQRELSVIELKNGELISVGGDGTLRRWRDSKPVGQPIQTGQGGVSSVIELKNGELISGGDDGTLRRWRDGKAVDGGQPIQTGQEAVVNLIELKNGELVSGGTDRTLRRWRDGRPVGQPIQTDQGGVSSLIELKNGELISVGDDGTLRRWRDGRPVDGGQPIQTGQRGPVELIELKNGELISGGLNGTLRRWRDGRPVDGGQPIQTGQGWVSSLIELKNGELVSGGGDGTLRRWRDGKPVDGGQPIETGQGRVVGLIELKNGELVSRGGDGTLRWFSPRRVVGFACGEALPELMRSPETMEDKEASSLCRRFGFLR